MSKFCANCGSMLTDDAAFCGNCGAKQEVTQQTGEYVYEAQPQEPVYEGYENPAQPKEKNAVQKVIDWAKAKPLLAGGIVLAVVAAVVGILFLSGAFGNSYDEAIDNYIAIMSGETSEEAVKKMYPECAWDEIDIEEVADELEETMDYMPSGIDYSYDVLSEEEITGTMYKELKNILQDEYNVDPDDVGEAYQIELELTMKYQGETQTRNSGENAAVVEIDGEWYLLNIEMYDGELEDASFFEF